MPRPPAALMRAPALPVALALLLPALAGCTVESPTLQGQIPSPQGNVGPSPPGTVAGNETTAIDLNLTAEAIMVPAPTWHIGDSWKWALNFGGPTGAQQLVVVGDQGSDYTMATADRTDAVLSAFFGASLPGKVAKATLGPYFDGVPSKYFDFPLQQNKTWTTQIRGTDYAMKANFTRQLEGGFGPGFLLQGASTQGNRVLLAYAPSAKWTSKVLFTDPGGNATFSRTLQSYNANYSGPWYLGKSADLYKAQRSSAQPGVPADSFNQARSYSTLHIEVFCSGGGTVAARIFDPANNPRYNYTFAGGGQDFQDADLPSAPGTWKVVWTVSGFVDCSMRVGGIDVTEGKI